MKKIASLLFCFTVLPVYSQVMFGTLTSSRPTDNIIETGKEGKIIALDVWSRQALLGKQVSLELQYAAGEVFLYHNPVGTLEVSPAIGKLSDVKDLRLVNVQGQTVATARIAATLPESFDSQVSPGEVTQVLFEPVPGIAAFRGETLFAVVRVGDSFVTDDVIGVGIRKIAFRDSTGAVEAYEPFSGPSVATSFISLGSTIISPTILTVSKSPSTPVSVSPADNVVGAKFQIAARSIRPGSPMLYRAWQLQFEVSSGVVSALGNIKVLNEAGTVVKEQKIITRGDSPRKGMVFLEEADDGRSSGYSLKKNETLTIVFSTTAFAGADITVTSEELVAADFGFVGDVNLTQYGGLVHYGTLVSTVVKVAPPHAVPEPPVSSGGSGGGGGGGGGGPVNEFSDITTEMVKDVQFRLVMGGPIDGEYLAIIWLQQPFLQSMVLDLGIGTDHWQTSIASAHLYLNTPITVLGFVVPKSSLPKQEAITITTEEWLRQKAVIKILLR